MSQPDATTPDRAAAILAEVRERYDGAAAHKDLYQWARDFEERGGGSEYDWMARSLIDVPRLLGAMQAALARHQRREQPVRSWDLNLRCPAHAVPRTAQPPYGLLRDCPDCTYRDRYVCINPDCREHEWPCPDYEVITTALLGDTDDQHDC